MILSKRRSGLSSILLIILVLLGVGTCFGAYYWYRVYRSETSSFVQTPNEVSYSISSEIPGLTVKESGGKELWFNSANQLLKYRGGGKYWDFDTGQPVAPQQIGFIFRDIGILNSAEVSTLNYQMLEFNTNNVLAGYSSQSEGDELYYYIYLRSDYLLQAKTPETLVADLSFHILRALQGADFSQGGKGLDIMSIESDLRVSKGLTPLVVISETKPQSLLKVIDDFLVPPVFALSGCPNNTILCGITQDFYVCKNGSGATNNQGCLSSSSCPPLYPNCQYSNSQCGQGSDSPTTCNDPDLNGTCSNPICSSGCIVYGSCVPPGGGR